MFLILSRSHWLYVFENLGSSARADARFLGGKPVDYIVYKGYSRAYDTDQPIDEIVFLEIKTSKEKKRGLDRNEAKIKDAIEAKRVRHDTITIHVAEWDLTIASPFRYLSRIVICQRNAVWIRWKRIAEIILPLTTFRELFI